MDRMPDTAVARSTMPLSGWPLGEVRRVPVDGRLLRRAAAGLVVILPDDTPIEPAPAQVDLDAPPAAHDLTHDVRADGDGESDG